MTAETEPGRRCMEIGSGAQMEGWQGTSAFIPKEKAKNKGNDIANFIAFLERGPKIPIWAEKEESTCGNPEEVLLRPQTHVIPLTLAK